MPPSVGLRAVVLLHRSSRTAVTARAPARSGEVNEMAVAGS